MIVATQTAQNRSDNGFSNLPYYPLAYWHHTIKSLTAGASHIYAGSQIQQWVKVTCTDGSSARLTIAPVVPSEGPPPRRQGPPDQLPNFYHTVCLNIQKPEVSNRLKRNDN